MIDLIDRPEFQQFLQYMSQNQTFLVKDLFSRSSIEDSIIQEAHSLHNELIKEIEVYTQNLCHGPFQLMPNQLSPGNPCFTFDFWPRDKDDGHHGLLATTVHWCTEAANGDLLVKSQLASIQYLKEQWYQSALEGIVEGFPCTGTDSVGGHDYM